MKQYILLLVLMVMGAGIHAYAEDVNPVKEGNVISGHVVENGLSCNSWGITLCNFPFMHTPLLIYTGRTSYLPLHEMKP